MIPSNGNDERTPLRAGNNTLDNKEASGDYVVRLENNQQQQQTGEDHKTSYTETVIHLLKGYIGCGILSLPWAVTQLGLVPGVLGICTMSLWSSYNCWTVVKLKRFVERTEQKFNDNVSEDSAVSGGTSITYPDVGNWALGSDFQKYISICISVQQLAICTVFLSFIAENLLAVMEFCDLHFVQTHYGMLTIALPFVLMLSFIPTLRAMTPAMAAGTILLFLGFTSLAITGFVEWGTRPPEDLPTFQPAKAPSALCAILYSFEGICLILPVESAMKEPKGFKSAFIISMSLVALLLCLVSVLCVLAFGQVTNGSITAFLLEEYKGDQNATLWLMLCNTLVSLSILLTYPLQLFPAVELVGPAVFEYTKRRVLEEEQSLNGFEPTMADIPEHDEPSFDSLPEHDYGAIGAIGGLGDVNKTGMLPGTEKEDEEDKLSVSRLSSMGQSMIDMLPEMKLPGDSLQLRVGLVFITYAIAMVVPNVESLVSLAGAVAGSSTALLIPPILELAWIRHMEKQSTSCEREIADGQSWIVNGGQKYRFERIKCWFLLALGVGFASFGVYFSIRDVLLIYFGPQSHERRLAFGMHL